MAISIRGNAGAWVAANATTQTVTLPTHVAGDMLIVRVAFKHATMPTTVTCDTAGWAKVGQYNNGTTVSGNGTGSVIVAVFWKVAASDAETNPVITYHASVAATPSAACPVVYQKGAAETWLTPVGDGGSVGTTTSLSATIVSHVSTTAGDMVDFFLSQGDNNTLTVPTFTQTGLTLDTVAEQPADALSSATSNDIDADGGYRLATAGTSSAAAVVTGTSTAGDQGSAWTTRLRVEAANNQLVTPGTASLTLTPQTPTVTLSDNKTVTPGTAALTLTPLAPTVATTAHQTVTPGTASLALTPQAPTVTASDHKVVTPGTASLTLTPLAPTASVSDNQTVTPGAASLTLTPQAPTVAVSDNIAVTPGAASLALTAFAPSAILSDHQVVTPGVAALTLTPYAPTVTGGAGTTVTPGTASLALTAFAPNVVLSDHQLVTPGTASLTLTPYAPTVTGGAGLTVTPGTVALSLTAFAPDVVLTDHKLVTPGTASLSLTAYAPVVSSVVPLPASILGAISSTLPVNASIGTIVAVRAEIAKL